MPTARVAPDLEMHYLVDDFADPWRNPDRCARETFDFISRVGASAN